MLATRGSRSSDGGNCTSRGPRFLPRPAISSRNRSSGRRARRNFRSCVMVRGSLTANRNSGGVPLAHFAYVVDACGRWNDELISAHGSTRPYRSRCVPSPAHRCADARGIDQPAVPMYTRLGISPATHLAWRPRARDESAGTGASNFPRLFRLWLGRPCRRRRCGAFCRFRRGLGLRRFRARGRSLLLVFGQATVFVLASRATVTRFVAARPCGALSRHPEECKRL